jgi:PAS domain-containing protein
VNTQHQPPTQQGPGDAGFLERLDTLRARLERLRAQDVAPGDRVDQVDQDLAGQSLEMMADLDTAYEELRVADEEVRTQQDQIARLLESHQQLHWQHERMLAMLPVPALITDSDGLIRSVNAAAAALTATRPARLLGKPIFGLFDPSDRRELRLLLGAGQPRVTRTQATVFPQDGAPMKADLWVTLSPGENPEATWLLLTRAGRGTHDRPEALPEALTELAGLTSEIRDAQAVLNRAAEICRRTLDGVEVSIQIGPPDRPDAVSSTSRLPQEVDGDQIAKGEGPTVVAFTTRSVVSSLDLRSDARWPRLARLRSDRLLSIVAAPVEVGPRVVGTLTVYSEERSLDPSVEEAVELLAATLGAVIHELELNSELDRLGQDMQRALSSRAVIEQAKGIIMAQRGCGPDEAFAFLADLSSRQERKLRDVARDVVDRATRGD